MNTDFQTNKSRTANAVQKDNSPSSATGRKDRTGFPSKEGNPTTQKFASRYRYYENIIGNAMIKRIYLILMVAFRKSANATKI
jgi:hypothetical protein